MLKKAMRHRLEAVAALAGCAVLAPLAIAGPAGAAVHAAHSTSPGSEFGFTASAYSTYVITGGKAVSTPSAATGFACETTPRTVSNSGTGVSISADSTSTGSVTNEASLTNTRTTATGSATSTVQSVDILGGMIKATDVTESASASETSGSWAASGSATFTGLTIGGKSQADNPAPNTRINLAGIGEVYLNYQAKSVGTTGASMGADAMVVDITSTNSLHVPVGTTIFIGHASVTGAGPISGTLSGGATATSVDGPEGSSAASFPAGVACMGPSSTETNGAGVTFSPLSTGPVTDTAAGVDSATTLSAKTSSTVTNVKVARILSFGGVKANASAVKSGSGVSTSGSVTLNDPKLLGTGVPVLPPHPSANYTVKINGVTLVLNRQVKSANGITVQALYLTGQSIGTIVVGAASADAYPGG